MKKSAFTKTSRKIPAVFVRMKFAFLVGMGVASVVALALRAEAQTIYPASEPIRARIGGAEKKIGHFDDQQAVLEFVSSREMEALAELGTSCPDHFLRTKRNPLVVDFDPANPDIGKTLEGLAGAVEEYRKGHAAYYERCKRPDSPPMRDPNAVVYLVPGVGMITFAKDKATARVSAEFYVNAINVMRGASSSRVSTLSMPGPITIANRSTVVAAGPPASVARRRASTSSAWSCSTPTASFSRKSSTSRELYPPPLASRNSTA
jgi:hypothetical protein